MNENERNNLYSSRIDREQNRFCFGGWTSGMTTLIIFMSVDYAAGLVVADIFRNSEKTKSGNPEFRVGWKGMFLVPLVITQSIDILQRKAGKEDE